jgi:hypothetical protein
MYVHFLKVTDLTLATLNAGPMTMESDFPWTLNLTIKVLADEGMYLL